MLTQKRLKYLVNYDPNTGAFLSRIQRSTCKSVLGCKAVRGKMVYLRIVIDRKHYYAHRLAWFYVYGEMPKLLDHVNGDGCDNRIKNLREASHSDNHANTAWNNDNKTGFKGVSVAKSGRYYASIHKDGKSLNLGHYTTPEEAHAAYRDAAHRLFGNFANAGSGGG